MLDYKIDNSVIEKNEDGTPKQRIALRYKMIDYIDDLQQYHWSKDEHYSFSGSKIMIQQAMEDFSKDDLPAITVIKEHTNKLKKKLL